MMKVYLASRYSRRAEMRQVRADLQRLGFVVTSRWIDTECPDDEREHGTSSAVPPEKRVEFCLHDIADVEAAEYLISFTEPSRTGRGGRHVEFGMGIALNKRLIVVGPLEHIFHHHPSVLHLHAWDAELVAAALSKES